MCRELGCLVCVGVVCDDMLLNGGSGVIHSSGFSGGIIPTTDENLWDYGSVPTDCQLMDSPITSLSPETCNFYKGTQSPC